MKQSLSPLRYPGGKYKIYDKVKNLIEINEFGDKIYVEPFAGGFGIGLGLLRENIVEKVILNDFDSHIYNFWYAVINHPDEFIKKMMDTSITIEEREIQKKVYKDANASQIDDGFATFFLNRVNFSGIITGGPIGGFKQDGTYKLDCRFNKDRIKNKIKEISSLKDRIELYNYDAGELITFHLQERLHECFFNIDPPYVVKGYQLYTNYFKDEDHRNFKEKVEKHLSESVWIVTYDNCELVTDIYNGYHMVEYEILHNAGRSTKGKEIAITNIDKNCFIW